jgi:RNA polymerase sigma-70 factor (ECF subfamily)
MSDEQELCDRARGGDRTAFEALVAQGLPALRGVVRRMVGHPEDTNDIVQEALAKAWKGIGGFRGKSRFGTWLVSIGARTAIDHMRAQKLWRAHAQIAHANACQGSEALGMEILGAVSAPDFVYEAREHIAYCLTCVGRSLPPEQQGALVLREIMDLPGREAAQALHMSESVYRHHLSDARRAMEANFEGLCSLVNKNGVCYQCKGLRDTAPPERRGGEIPVLNSFEDRLACARAANVDDGAAQALHDVGWRQIKAIEAEGAVSDEPQSNCGQ